MDQLIIIGAKYLFAVALLGAAIPILLLPKEQRTPYLLRAIFAGFAAFLLSKLAGGLYNDPRPFTQGVHALIAHDAENGFTSDHATLSFTAAFLAMWYDKRLGAGLVVVAAIVGICRVLAGVHHPIDIVGGIVIAAIATGIGTLVVKMSPFGKPEPAVD